MKRKKTAAEVQKDVKLLQEWIRVEGLLRKKKGDESL